MAPALACWRPSSPVTSKTWSPRCPAFPSSTRTSGCRCTAACVRARASGQWWISWDRYSARTARRAAETASWRTNGQKFGNGRNRLWFCALGGAGRPRLYESLVGSLRARVENATQHGRGRESDVVKQDD